VPRTSSGFALRAVLLSCQCRGAAWKCCSREGLPLHIPCGCDDDVVHRRVALAEAREPDPYDHAGRIDGLVAGGVEVEFSQDVLVPKLFGLWRCDRVCVAPVELDEVTSSLSLFKCDHQTDERCHN